MPGEERTIRTSWYVRGPERLVGPNTSLRREAARGKKVIGIEHAFDFGSSTLGGAFDGKAVEATAESGLDQ
jgi:hypothetical protein